MEIEGELKAAKNKALAVMTDITDKGQVSNSGKKCDYHSIPSRAFLISV